MLLATVGAGAPAGATAPAAKVATSLTATISASTVAYDGTIKLTGKLTRSSGAALSGKKVSLYGRAPLTTTWKLVTSATTSSTGTYSFTRSALRAAQQFRTTFAGDTGFTAATSPTRMVRVTAPFLSSTVTPSDATVRLGSTVTWTVRTATALSGSSAEVQAYSGGSWGTVASAPVRPNGSVAIPFTVYYPKATPYRVRLPEVYGVLETAASPSRKIAAKTATITTTSLPTATMHAPYTATVKASYVLAPLTWSVEGDLPPGLTFSKGKLTGTPTSAGTWPITVTLGDSSGYTDSAQLDVVVVEPATPVILDADLPQAVRGLQLAYPVQAVGGHGARTWSRTAGTLPAGITLRPDGTLVGTPTADGTSTFTLRVEDAEGASASAALSLTVVAPVDWLHPEVGPAGASTTTDGVIRPSDLARLRVEQTRAPSAATAVAGGVLYTSGQFETSQVYGLIASSLSTGEELWRAPVLTTYGQSVDCTEIFVTAALVICQTQGAVVAFDRGGDHDVAWSTLDTEELTTQTAVVVGDRLIAAHGAGSTWSLRAWSLATGVQLWQRPLGDMYPSDIASDGTRVFVSFWDAPMRTFAVGGTGTPGWTAGTDVQQVLVVGGDVITSEQLPSGATSVVRRSAATGAVVWSTTPSRPVYLDLAADATNVYVPTAQFSEWGGAYDTGVIALRLTDGTQRWVMDTWQQVWGGITVAPGVVWVHTSGLIREQGESQLYAVDPATGAVLRQIAIPGPTYLQPIVADGKVLARYWSGMQVLSINAPLPVLPLQLLSPAWTGTAYSTDLAASGGTGSRTWALTSGSLPAGLTLTSGGRISGTPATAGSSSFVVRVTDAAGRTASRPMALAVRTAATSTWVTGGGGATRSGFAASEAAVNVDAMAGFAQRWRSQAFEQPSGNPHGWRGGEVVVDATRVLDLGQDGSLRLFPTSGTGAVAPTWTASVPGGLDGEIFAGTPTLSGSSVIALTNRSRVVVLDAATGASSWSTLLPAESPADGTGSVLPVGGRLVVHVGKNVYALSAGTHAVVWTAPVPANSGYDGFDLATDGTRLFGYDKCDLVALDAATGARVWTKRFGYPGSSCTSAGYESPYVAPVVADGVVYGTGLEGITAFDPATGAVLWQTREPTFFAPAVSERWIALTSIDGGVVLVDRTTGASVLRSATSLGASTAPVLVGDAVVVRDNSGRLVALDIATLQTQWSSPALPAGLWGQSASHSRPSVAGGRIWAYANDGSIRAYGG
ncbi:hypothetical protein CCO02nite_25210 [Cellulomonas composti]|uniref:Pyrrolo-quinoline quinone repeat domain-containing protein n=1 Tax=Cellulomonas composti TaxID=266130 RepID=A0A511JDQ9_9CELL|nr:hypothetical protein CCO02nite_25210 [Cellulomonas composti]